MRNLFVTGFLSVLSLLSSRAYAGWWTEPTTITDVGAWIIWFGVTTTDQVAAYGCSGSGTKAIDITTANPTNIAQQSLLLAAFTSGRKVKLYYEKCYEGVSIITNVHIVN